MSTFGDMITRISDELKRSDITTAQIENAIISSVEHYARYRLFFNETVTTQSTTASQNYIDVPTDFVEEDMLEITVGSNTYELQKIEYTELIKMGQGNTSTGQPVFYAYYRDRFRLHPTPNNTYTVTIHYVKKLATLVDSTDSNEWTNDAEELIRIRAKKDIFMNHIRNYPAARIMDEYEKEAFNSLMGYSNRITGTGRIKARYL